MSDCQNPENGNTKPKCHVLAEDTKTQKSDEDSMIVKMRDGSTRTAAEDIFLAETILDPKKHISEKDCDVPEKTISDSNNASVKTENSKENRKKRVLCDKNITDCTNAHKRSKTEFCNITDQVISTLVTQNGISPDSAMEIHSPAGQKKQENSPLTGNGSIFQNYHSENQGQQKFNLEDKMIFNSGKNTVSNMNVSQYWNKLDIASDSHGSKEKCAFSIDYILAMPGPSRPRENIPHTNFSAHIFDNLTLLIEKVTEKKKVTSISSACNENEISECKPFFCNVCNVSFLEVGSHEVKQTCDVCVNIFPCVRQLEDHYLVHEHYHCIFCRICKNEINKHIGKGVRRFEYKCCYQRCEYGTSKIYSFKAHLYTHSPLRLFNCKWCGERFRTKTSLWKHFRTHPNCKICEKNFFDSLSLKAQCSEHDGNGLRVL